MLRLTEKYTIHSPSRVWEFAATWQVTPGLRPNLPPLPEVPEGTDPVALAQSLFGLIRDYLPGDGTVRLDNVRVWATPLIWFDCSDLDPPRPVVLGGEETLAFLRGGKPGEEALSSLPPENVSGLLARLDRPGAGIWINVEPSDRDGAKSRIVFRLAAPADGPAVRIIYERPEEQALPTFAGEDEVEQRRRLPEPGPKGPKPGQHYEERNTWNGADNTTQPHPSPKDPKPGHVSGLLKWLERRTAYDYRTTPLMTHSEAYRLEIIYSREPRAEGVLRYEGDPLTDQPRWVLSEVSCVSSEEGRKAVKQMVAAGLMPETTPVTEVRGEGRPSRVWLRWSGGFSCTDDPADMDELEKFFASGEAGDAIVTNVSESVFARLADCAGAAGERGSIFRRGLRYRVTALRTCYLVWLWRPVVTVTGDDSPPDGAVDYVRREQPDHFLSKEPATCETSGPAPAPETAGSSAGSA